MKRQWVIEMRSDDVSEWKRSKYMKHANRDTVEGFAVDLKRCSPSLRIRLVQLVEVK